MNKELKELLSKQFDNVPSVFAKVANGKMTYNEFFDWVMEQRNQQYFLGKQAVVAENPRDVSDKLKKFWLDNTVYKG